MNPRTNEVADTLLVHVEEKWWFTRRDWPAVEGKVCLAGPFEERETALRHARHPEWSIRGKHFPRSVLAGGEAVDVDGDEEETG